MKIPLLLALLATPFAFTACDDDYDDDRHVVHSRSAVYGSRDYYASPTRRTTYRRSAYDDRGADRVVVRSNTRYSDRDVYGGTTRVRRVSGDGYSTTRVRGVSRDRDYDYDDDDGYRGTTRRSVRLTY